MARDRVPVLKRCRSLGLDPIYLGIEKKSKKENAKAGKKIEKQFRGYFARAEKMRDGIPGENLLILLELRLDNVMFRLGYGRTRKEARQIVRHKHVLVNGKAVDIPSYQLKVGDVISIKDKYADMQRYKNILDVTDTRVVPEWLSADHENLKGTVVCKPTRAMIDVPVEETLIVELYSK